MQQFKRASLWSYTSKPNTKSHGIFPKHPSSNGEAFETVRQAMPGPAKDLAAEEMRRIMTEWHGGHSTPGGKCCKKTTGDSQGEQKLMNSL